GENHVGGLARTLRFGDFRFDIGGHRFHSRWPEITQWVLATLDGDAADVPRRSRIRLDGRYVDYPLRFPNALAAFNPWQATRILWSYLWATVKRLRRRPDVSFEDWIVRRFGSALYDIYFKPYTEKVWGIPCAELSADWASQRIRLPSLSAAVTGSVMRRSPAPSTLVSQFLYPPLGIGALPDSIADKARQTGLVTIHVGSRVSRVEPDGADGWRVIFQGPQGESAVAGEDVVSTIPLERLLAMLPLPVSETRTLAAGLPYRSLACVFLTADGPRVSGDTWTYFPDSHLSFGRTHEPRNWSARMAPEGKTSLCVEIFCSEGDEVWRRSDQDMIEPVLVDLDRLGFLPRRRVRDAWALRVSHAYPIYRVGYGEHLARVESALSRWTNLHLLGRTGTFRYLNLDAVIHEGIGLARSLCPGR
ncbi:MAG TPA: FAD-dependent oxidoreductase, partial [Polyangia bacterium]